MKANIEDYIGKNFGNLTVVGIDASLDRPNANHWIFRCSCGATFSEYPSRVLSGHKKSCGCQKGKSSFVHGCNGDEFYPTWYGMMRRCYNASNHNYSRYGGRGITVCDEWHNPQCFIEWARSTAGSKSPGLTLDRVDNSKGYSPDNCKWSTAKAQANNRRNNSLETIDGDTRTLSEWCSIYGIKPETVRNRQKRGMSLLEALTTPVFDTRFAKHPMK